MPKESKTRPISFEARSRASPFPCSSSSGRRRGSSSSSSGNPAKFSAESTEEIKEWDDVRCAVCMEHPHNAVLLACASSDKGCQPFMCDTSYRHSNCLDQYKKSFPQSSSSEGNSDDQEKQKLLCPLCRGEVTGWKVVEVARRYMNAKVRNCSTESCSFSGCYRELRKHARKEHPSVRPSEADPERQRDWRRMEQRRDLGDLFSSMQSFMGGEDGQFGGSMEDDEELGMRSIFRISSMAVFFIFTFSAGGVGRGRTSARSSRVASRLSSRTQRREGRLLWGETHSSESQPNEVNVSGDGDGDGDMDDDADNDNGEAAGSNSGGSDEVSATPRRVRLTRWRQLRDEETDVDDGSTL